MSSVAIPPSGTLAAGGSLGEMVVREEGGGVGRDGHVSRGVGSLEEEGSCPLCSEVANTKRQLVPVRERGGGMEGEREEGGREGDAHYNQLHKQPDKECETVEFSPQPSNHSPATSTVMYIILTIDLFPVTCTGHLPEAHVHLALQRGDLTVRVLSLRHSAGPARSFAPATSYHGCVASRSCTIDKNGCTTHTTHCKVQSSSNAGLKGLRIVWQRRGVLSSAMPTSVEPNNRKKA